MKGGFKFSTTWMLCLLAAALFQQIVTVSGVYNMPQTCAQLGQGWIADPNDCKSFGYCNNSVLVGTKRCDQNYVYNARRAECQYPTADACTVANVCQYAPDRSYAAHPSDCSSYYYCEKRAGKLLTCPAGQIFDSRTTTCVWSSKSANNLCSARSICRLVPDGKFAGDPDSCGTFVSCINGVGTAGKCDDGTYYNKDLGGCQPQNPCQAATPVGIGLGVLQPLPNNPDVCRTQKEFPAWVTDGKTCMGYYMCKTNTGPGAWRKCGLGLHFDNGKCVNPYTYACPYDRCGNMNQGFVGAINKDCKNYLICRNQTSQAQTYRNYVGLPCPADNPYFDEYSQRCLSTSPANDNYKLCLA